MDIVKKSLTTLEFDKVLQNLVSYAKTKQSKILCETLEPETDFEKIQKSLRLTAEAKELVDKLLELPIEYLADLSNIDKNQLNFYLEEDELLNIAKSLRSARYVKNFIRENTVLTSELNTLSSEIQTNKELEDEIFEKFDETNKIKKDASAELARLYTSLKDTEQNLKSKINEFLSSYSQYLQESIYTIRDNRIVFPVMASAKGKVSGIIHDSSATNKTIYVEPSDFVELNNKIRELKIKIKNEIVRILTHLTHLVKVNFDILKSNEEILALLDFHFAKARYAVKIKAIEPELTKEKILKFEGIKHPLLIDRVSNIVTNDFSLGHEYTSIIITGSNTGGKTVTLKTIGLYVLMARAGMFLPCLSAKIYPFENILADIGDEQDLTQNLSTFSSHMNNIINILNIANSDTLVLLDEICAGTDPQEGVSLAEVILEDIVNKDAFSVITTHFAELKSLEYTNPKFKNACVEFDKQTLKPTYKLTIGIPGASNAIFIARNLGLDEELVEKAQISLNIHRDPSAVVIEKLQETQQKLSKNLSDVEHIKSTSQRIKDEYEIKLAELRRDKKKLIKSLESKFLGEFDNARLEIKEIINSLRNDTSEKNARRSYINLSHVENDIKNKIDNVLDKQLYDELIWDSIKVGDKVMIKELNQPVTIVSLPDKNDNLMVQMGLIKTKISKNQVAKLDTGLVKKPQLRLKYSPLESFEFVRNNLSNKLDLRGYRVDDALECLETYLDRASVSNLTPVYIIHGHGTGALKSYIRDYVSTSPYVSKYRAGEESEGGDGVTVIDIN
ncbi:endonuclease MutS2 [bacterium]|nr:endonuclease MutS2 [bacterium]